MPLTLAQQPDGSNLIAIDIPLEPNAVLSAKARAVDAWLRKKYPEGNVIDQAYWPHITLVRQFVRASDLDAVAAAVTGVRESDPPPPDQTR